MSGIVQQLGGGSRQIAWDAADVQSLVTAEAMVNNAFASGASVTGRDAGDIEHKPLKPGDGLKEEVIIVGMVRGG